MSGEHWSAPLPEEAPVWVVIPALDEEECLPRVLADLAAQPAPLREVVVVDNGSRDRTAERARAAGATVLEEPQRGYGAACLCALAHIEKQAAGAGGRGIVVFLDGDHSDYPEDLAAVVAPVATGEAELVVGSRLIYPDARRAVPLPSRVGNAIATRVIAWLTGVRYTDLGPFRAISLEALHRLGMRDRSWGWTVEMQLRAARLGLRSQEIAVRYRRRGGGESKISGSLWGGLRAGAKILWVLGRHSFASRRAPSPS